MLSGQKPTTKGDFMQKLIVKWATTCSFHNSDGNSRRPIADLPRYTATIYSANICRALHERYIQSLGAERLRTKWSRHGRMCRFAERNWSRRADYVVTVRVDLMNGAFQAICST